MSLQEYLPSLLRIYDCVVIPRLGGFVANNQPAVIDHFKKSVYPPSKRVLFNEQLTTNDGLLANHVVHEQKMTYAAALDYIERYVDSWRVQLDNGQRIEIGEIGFLYRENTRIHFEQSLEINLLSSAYGLGTVGFRGLHRIPSKDDAPTAAVLQRGKTREPLNAPTPPIRQRQSIAIQFEKGVPVRPTKKGGRKTGATAGKGKVPSKTAASTRRSYSGRVGNYAAAAAVLLLLFYAYWIPMKTDALETGAVQSSDFNPVHIPSKKCYNKRTTTFEPDSFIPHSDWGTLTQKITAEIYNLELSDDYYITIDLLGSSKVKPVQTEYTYETSSHPISESENGLKTRHYCVIAGCFSLKRNAQYQIQQLRKAGFSASILDKKGGLYRVSIGVHGDRKSARQELNTVRSAGFSCWMLNGYIFD